MARMTGTISAAALGDPRALYDGVAYDEDIGRSFEADAEEQLRLRAMIRPGGRRELYLDHLHELADDTGAALTFYHPKGFIAQWRAETRIVSGMPARITTPLPFTQSHYLTGLHEFGHVYQADLGGTSNHGVTPEGIYGELMAHVWAFEHSKVLPIPDRDLEHARISLLFDARENGWTGGSVADFLPAHLRNPYSEAFARLERWQGSAGGDA